LGPIALPPPSRWNRTSSFTSFLYHT